MQRERLSENERKIMEIIWESNKELSRGEILIQYNERFGKNWKRQTANTFVSRAEEKGYLTTRPINGKASVVVPLISKEEYLREELERISKDWKVSKEYLKGLL